MKNYLYFLTSLWDGVFWKIAVVILAFIAALCLVQLFRCPPWYWLRWRRGMEQIGMYNAEGTPPLLLSVRKDRHKAHGRILTVRNFGLSVEYIDNKVPELEAVLNGKIYAIEYGRNTMSTRIFLLPHRYVQPKLISVHSDELVKIPNYLVVGETGSGKSYALTVLLALFAYADKKRKFIFAIIKIVLHNLRVLRVFLVTTQLWRGLERPTRFFRRGFPLQRMGEIKHRWWYLSMNMVL